jgi:hypothetical protein
MFEEAVTYGLMNAIGLPAVAVELVRGGRFSGAVTLCLGFVVLGSVGLTRMLARRHVLPPARARVRDHQVQGR